MTKIIPGFSIKIFINGKVFGEVNQASWTVDSAEQEIDGIDSMFAQEIASVRHRAFGSFKGFRIRQSNGLASINARPILAELIASPYISIRIQDRHTGEDLIYFPKAKITSESYSVGAKGMLMADLSFRALAGWQPLDRA